MTNSYELLGAHVVKDALSILTVVSTFHDRQQQFRRVVLKNKAEQLYMDNVYKIHSFPVDIILNSIVTINKNFYVHDTIDYCHKEARWIVILQ